MPTLSTTACDNELRQALSRVILRDGTERFRLCEADLTLVEIVRRVLGRQGGRTRISRIEIPRGDHDVAVTLAIIAQLVRLREGTINSQAPTYPSGSFIVVGTDTSMHARLNEISIMGMPLAAGLNVHRIRGDGQIVSPTGEVLRFQPGRRELLYLNTRVGWPPLANERDGAVIIDRTSISNQETLSAALEWCQTHRVRQIIVLHDHGDIAAKMLCDFAYVLDAGTLASVNLPAELARVRTGLTLNSLLSRPRPTVGIARVDASAVEGTTAEIHRLLSEARDIDKQLPYPLFAATRLLAVANGLVCRVLTHDQTVAMVPRGMPLMALAGLVAGGQDRLTGAWARFRETRMGTLRGAVERLVGLLEAENPKFSALVYLLDDLRRRRPRPMVTVRVSSEAAAFAATEDVEWFDQDLASPDHVRFVPYGKRLPYPSDENVVEILAGLPPQWYRQAIWSGEAAHRIILAYGWEAYTIARSITEERERAERLAPPFWPKAPVPIDTVEEVFRYKHREEDEPPAPASWEIDISALTSTVELAEPGGGGAGAGSVTGPNAWPVTVHVVALEPGTDVWLVPERAEVEVLVGRSYRHLRPADLRGGEHVIVPRGTGRTTLFSRAVGMVHREGTYIDADVILGRWRRACRRVLDIAGSPYNAEQLLREAGCRTVTQLEAWADGSTIAPDRPEDMQQVAILAEDDWLQRNWRRVAHLATQVRGTHIRIGQTISAAMREAVHGRGRNLNELAELLGVDAASIVDEFDVRIVQTVSAPRAVPAHFAGVVRARSQFPENVLG